MTSNSVIRVRLQWLFVTIAFVGLLILLKLWQNEPNKVARLIVVCFLINATYFFLRKNKWMLTDESTSVPTNRFDAKDENDSFDEDEEISVKDMKTISQLAEKFQRDESAYRFILEAYHLAQSKLLRKSNPNTLAVQVSDRRLEVSAAELVAAMQSILLDEFQSQHASVQELQRLGIANDVQMESAVAELHGAGLLNLSNNA